jgi:hypothetical protein
MMESATSTRLRGFGDERSVGLVERSGFLRIDPYTAGAAIALIVTSVVVLALTTKGDVPGDPYFYVIRQSIYAVVGIALMLALTRVDYTRFRELRVGIYTALLWPASSSTGSAGSPRRSAQRVSCCSGSCPQYLYFYSPIWAPDWFTSSPRWPSSSSVGSAGRTLLRSVVSRSGRSCWRW